MAVRNLILAGILILFFPRPSTAWQCRDLPDISPYKDQNYTIENCEVLTREKVAQLSGLIKKNQSGLWIERNLRQVKFQDLMFYDAQKATLEKNTGSASIHFARKDSAKSPIKAYYHNHDDSENFCEQYPKGTKVKAFLTQPCEKPCLIGGPCSFGPIHVLSIEQASK